MSERPNIVQLKESLTAILKEEEARCEPPRDIGLECYRVLEQQRGHNRAAGERGGSVIRSKGALEAE